MKAIKQFLEYEILSVGEYKIQVFTLVNIFIIFLIAKLAIWLIKKALFRKNKFKKLDKGNAYVLFKMIKYVIWVIAFAFALEAIGIQVTVLLAGSAALLVGVGLGLQKVFTDIISGIILLSEKTIKIDDVVEIDGDVIIVQSIGLRTSVGLNRDEIHVIIPNSTIISNKVINWSHQTKKTRFRINVGVAYGSNVDLVLKVLEESVFEHEDISDKEAIEVRFLDFGASSLDFQVLFYSENVFRIEKVKSDIRKIINRKFVENNITIPYPQMDLHIKSNYTDKK